MASEPDENLWDQKAPHDQQIVTCMNGTLCSLPDSERKLSYLMEESKEGPVEKSQLSSDGPTAPCGSEKRRRRRKKKKRKPQTPEEKAQSELAASVASDKTPTLVTGVTIENLCEQMTAARRRLDGRWKLSKATYTDMSDFCGMLMQVRSFIEEEHRRQDHRQRLMRSLASRARHGASWSRHAAAEEKAAATLSKLREACDQLNQHISDFKDTAMFARAMEDIRTKCVTLSDGTVIEKADLDEPQSFEELLEAEKARSLQ